MRILILCTGNSCRSQMAHGLLQSFDSKLEVFSGEVKNRLHIGFDDPSEATGSPEFIDNEFHRVRDEIKARFYDFYLNELKPQLN